MIRIRNKKELDFYIMADYMMNTGEFRPSLKRRILDRINPDYMMRFLVLMRKYSYYRHRGGLGHLLSVYYKLKYKKLSVKLGFTIDPDAFGYGLSLPHYGTIVVGSPAAIGNYAVLHTNVCLSGNGKIIGDALYVATGAKITAKVVLGDNVTLAANSVCTKSFENGNVLLAGLPAEKKSDSGPWYIRDGSSYYARVLQIEDLKKQMGLI